MYFLKFSPLTNCYLSLGEDRRYRMAVTQLFMEWVSEISNEEFLHHLSVASEENKSNQNHINLQKTDKEILEIQPFYPMKRSSKCILREIKRVSTAFESLLSGKQGLTKSEFESVTVNICGFSKYCNSLLFEKMGGDREDTVTLSMFVDFWRTHFSPNECIAFRFIQILKTTKDGGHFLVKSDLLPLVREILWLHPGLEFLRASSEFHDFYISTVICRVFYCADTTKNGRINVRELRRSNFLDILGLLDEEGDINEMFEYFSYEHFYVIFTKFWELDEDGDDELTTQDLLKYEDYALTPKVVHRIMAGSAKKGRSNQKDMAMTMSYEDFVDFMISEQDKTSSVSINYWFRVLDLDGDGVLSPFELRVFYEEQSAKMMKICGETMAFENILDSLNDMVCPQKEYQFTVRDLKKSGMARPFFDTLINAKKVAMADRKDLEIIAGIRNSPHMTDWDRFASREYFALSQHA